MKALVLNQHTHNFGDDAAGDALIRVLNSHGITDVDVVLNGDDPDHPDPRIRIPSGVRLSDIGWSKLALYLVLPRRLSHRLTFSTLMRLRNIIKTADVVIVAPSGANLGIYRDWRFLIRLLIAVKEGKEPLFHYNTVGPSGNALFDRLALRVLRASMIYVRDSSSLAYVRSIGLAGEAGPDTAFALPNIDDELVRESVVSWVPSELDSWHPALRNRGVNARVLTTYVNSVATFAAANGFSVEILPHLRNLTERDFDTRIVAGLIDAGLDAEKVLFREDIASYRSYDRAIASSRLVIGGRYHSVVLAAKNRRPFISVSYEEKMREVCRYLGLPEVSVDIDDISVDEAALVSLLESVLGREKDTFSMLGELIESELVPSVHAPIRTFLERHYCES